MSVDEVKEKVRQRLDEPISEIHMVGGIHPDLPFSYYLDLLRGIKEVRPEVHIQAFTCVEIHHLAQLAGKPVDQTLDDLIAGRAWLPYPEEGPRCSALESARLTCERKLARGRLDRGGKDSPQERD